MTGRFGKKPLRPKKGNRFYQAEASWVPRNKDHNFYSQVLVYRLQNKRQNPKKPMKDTWHFYTFLFLQNMFPLSSQDTQYMTSIPQQIQLSPGLIIRAKLQWSTSILPEAFRKTQRKCFWFEEKPKPWVYLVGMGTTQRFFHRKNSFFWLKGSRFNISLGSHHSFSWLWVMTISAMKSFQFPTEKLRSTTDAAGKMFNEAAAKCFFVFFCDHWELEMIHDDNSLHWP